MSSRTRVASALSLSIVLIWCSPVGVAADDDPTPPIGRCEPRARLHEERPTLNELLLETACRINDAKLIDKSATLDLGADARFLITAMAVKDAAVPMIERSRRDEQIGSGPFASGTTALVSKASAPSVTSVTLESGGPDAQTSGTTLTIGGNAGGLVKALGHRGFLAVSGPAGLNQISGSVSFDTSRGVPPGETTSSTESVNEVSNWSARYEFFNTKSRGERAFWNEVIGTVSSADQAFATIAADIERVPEFAAWYERARKAVREIGRTTATTPPNLDEHVSAGGIAVILLQQVTDLPVLKGVTKELDAAIDGIDVETRRTIREAPSILRQVNQGLVFSVEYAFDRPAGELEQSTLRVAGEISRAVALTINGSVSFATGMLPSARTGRLQAVDASAQLDVPFFSLFGLDKTVLSTAGRFHRLVHDPALPVGTDLAGNVAVAQVKLTIGIKSAGIRIPLSVTFSNRTDLVREKQIRAHVGVSYDVDALLAKLRP